MFYASAYVATFVSNGPLEVLLRYILLPGQKRLCIISRLNT